MKTINRRVAKNSKNNDGDNCTYTAGTINSKFFYTQDTATIMGMNTMKNEIPSTPKAMMVTAVPMLKFEAVRWCLRASSYMFC